MFCNYAFFPNISTLLPNFGYAVSNENLKREEFSTIRRLKHYLRSTMKADRLNGLAFMSIFSTGFRIPLM